MISQAILPVSYLLYKYERFISNIKKKTTRERTNNKGTMENMVHQFTEEETRMANTYMKKNLISVGKNEILNLFHKQV